MFPMTRRNLGSHVFDLLSVSPTLHLPVVLLADAHITLELDPTKQKCLQYLIR